MGVACLGQIGMDQMLTFGLKYPDLPSTPSSVPRTKWNLDDPSESRALYYRGELHGRCGNWVDGVALQGIRRTQTDENHHLA